ncbi:hypothetical protein D3C76_1263590 [compost metagenome]
MHPAARMATAQLAVTLIGLGQQCLGRAQRHQRIDLWVEAFDVRQISLHHLPARHLAGMDGPGQCLGIEGNNGVDG